MRRNDEAGPAQDRPANSSYNAKRHDTGRLVAGEAVLVSTSTLVVAGAVVADIPRPRPVLSTDPVRVRVRHRLAVARRYARIVRAFDELLGLRQPAPADQVGEPVDYAAGGQCLGVPEREAAGRRWSP